MSQYAFIGERDYRAFAGGSWPTFAEFQAGVQAQDPEIQNEIESFVSMMQQTFQEIHQPTEKLAADNQVRQGQTFFNKNYMPNGCRVPWTTLGINANGNAFICLSPSWIPKYVGNILETEDIWQLLNSTTAQQIRQEVYHGRYYYCNNQICSFFAGVKPADYTAQNGSDTEPLPFESRPEYQVHEIPRDLIFDFDYTCNFHCPSCRTAVANNNKNHIVRTMNDQIVERIKTEIIDRVGTQPINIRWAQGEPFISEPYLELFRYIAEVNKPNIKHTIHTNGSYLKSKKDLLAKLLPSTRELRISFDAATAETYADVRRGGVWEILLDNVIWVKRYIEENNLATQITADFVVQRLNYKEIPAFEQLCKQLGIQHIQY